MKPVSGWQPPPHFVQELDKIIQHNLEHPEHHIGSPAISEWLSRNGVKATRNEVYKWMKKRSKHAE
jgi:hypothetical protein